MSYPVSYNHGPGSGSHRRQTQHPDPQQHSVYPWFVPGDGIAREVIRSDLPRYLGNDAISRPDTRDGVEGYAYYGYRPLTNAQIQSLKDDSARWMRERRNLERSGHQIPPYARSDTFMASQRNNFYGDPPQYDNSTSISSRAPHPLPVPERPDESELRYPYIPSTDPRPWRDTRNTRSYGYPYPVPGEQRPTGELPETPRTVPQTQEFDPGTSVRPAEPSRGYWVYMPDGNPIWSPPNQE